jgi:hypothetical protein
MGKRVAYLQQDVDAFVEAMREKDTQVSGGGDAA